MDMVEFAKKINHLGGEAYLVGGCVRDYFMQTFLKDHDYVITGVKLEDFKATFPNAQLVGNSFPVFLLEINHEKCEVAFARTERKVGTGYHGFETTVDPMIMIEEDLFRRDTTMNAIAIRIPDMAVIDPYKGREAISNRLIIPVSDHFKDDPVRALRAARQAAQHQFSLSASCKGMMFLCRNELKKEPSERIFGEMEKALMSPRPSVFFINLEDTGILDVTFPEIHALIGQTQPPQYHPEGDAFQHTMIVLDKVAQNSHDIKARFAALCHDLGKGLTPKEELPKHYGHDLKGLDVLESWNARMTLPKDWKKSAEIVCRYHMNISVMKKAKKILNLLLKVNHSKIGFDGFNAIIQADAHEGDDIVEWLKQGKYIADQMLAINGDLVPDKIKKRNGPRTGIYIEQLRIASLKKILYKMKHDVED